MSYSTTSTPMLSPHGVIGEHIQAQPRSQCQSPAYRHTLDLSGLTLTTRDDISVQSHRDREREIDIFQRGPFDPISKWCNNPNDLKPNDDGWERASANRFASRPPSPKKGEVFYDNYNEHPKTALPTFPAFNPIITPPPPHALLLPSHSNLPSPAHSERGRHVANQAGQHLSGLQGLMGPLVSQVDELERLQQELAHWKTSCEVANAELLQIKAVVAQPAVQAGPTYTAIIIDGDTQVFNESFLKSGFEGGQAAAQALVDGVKANNPQESSATSTVIHVFLNKSALGNSLVKSGLVTSLPVFDGFWQGFSTSQGLISVMDVGHVKDASQLKVEAYMEHYANQPSCVQIILASLNDQYIPDNAHPKLTWVGKPTDDNPQTRPFAHIFRPDPLPVAPPSFSSILLQPRPQAIIQMTENSNETSSASTLSTPEADVGYQDNEWDDNDMRIIEANKSNDDWTEARRKPAKKVIANAGGGGGGRERERSGRRGLAGTNNNPSSSGRDKDRRNKRGGKGRRDRERESMNVRDLKPRPCHSHYLSPKGCTNDDCHYGHQFELNTSQCDELSILAKQIPCPFARNKKCRNAGESCIYGHKCPRGRDCIFEDCRFDYIDPDHQAWE